MRTHNIIHEGTFHPEQEKTYVHLPFELPVDATRLQITYDYSHPVGSSPHLRGGNTIDLGLLDSRGIDFLQAGFRGWSGSERLSVSIGESEATPGYLAGPLPAGRWHVRQSFFVQLGRCPATQKRERTGRVGVVASAADRAAQI